jgi:hypothetical protein
MLNNISIYDAGSVTDSTVVCGTISPGSIPGLHPTHKKMTYQVYRKTLKKDEYFKKWDSGSYEQLNNALKEQIYEKYRVKCSVFQRDKFTCQNDICQTPESPLTMHHVKWQKNGGEHKERNCVTLCKTCHKGYHRGKNVLVFAEDSPVPKHIRGHTHKVSDFDEIDWKAIIIEMKKLRKTVKHEHGLNITEDQLKFLMKMFEYVSDYDA